MHEAVRPSIARLNVKLKAFMESICCLNDNIDGVNSVSKCNQNESKLDSSNPHKDSHFVFNSKGKAKNKCVAFIDVSLLT